jgi:hypothetical protein
MARERKTRNIRGKASADERYREFAKENAAWDSRVKKSIAEIDKAARGRAARHAAGS